MATNKYTVAAVSKFAFVPDGGGAELRGLKAMYFDGILPDEPDKRGMNIITITGDYGMWSEFVHVPGHYELSTQTRMKGKVAATVLTAVKCLGPVKVPGNEGQA